MKSWGTKIAILYTGFVGLILVMVFMAMRQKTDLVAADYYNRELHYQQQIDKTRRASEQGRQAGWEIRNDSLLLTFPGNAEATGTLQLFHPELADKDFTSSFSAHNHLCSIALPEHISGWYLLKLDWQADGTSYYQEKNVHILP